MSPHSDYHNYARMGAASGLTPNPFRKRVTLTASERTKKIGSSNPYERNQYEALLP